MQCPECQFKNPDGVKFCGACGNALQLICSHCNSLNPPGFKFCGECGCELSVTLAIKLSNQETAAEVIKAEDHTDDAIYSAPDSERKCVTVMFSDLTGYTEMSEKLDPEEVKEITGTIFSELTKIIEKYEGFIEKYIGDAILAVFGAKEAFEDSALRAIKAARDIHTYVDAVSPKYEEIIGRKLSMHTGINTGLVVTGEINYQKGTHGLVGDTINTAARLMGASQSGEIITDHDSYVQTEGYYEFESLSPVTVKGKAKPIKVYKVGNALQAPKKLHRLHGLRADLIGRSIEMQVLKEAAERLEQGNGSVVSICGTAGTGKSRLVYEFKNAISLEKVQWFDAGAFPYTQNIPYYPLIDLLSRAFDIKDGDNSETINLKIESNLEGLLGKGSEHVAYIGSLLSSAYYETKEVSPEYWKNRLYASIVDILEALTSAAPTVICLEDLHWADPSTVELIRKLVSNLSAPLMVICTYRPIITIFTDFEINTLPIEHTELRLRDLSPSESQDMICSLLKTNRIPKELRGFIRDNIDGNPFYVEEFINALIDSEALSKNSGQWEIIGNIDESIGLTNVQSVVAGRIDRLGYETKRILQEASVIGRAFLFDILQRISETRQDIDKKLVTLERLDLIKAKSIRPTLEYIFKHALTQEVVYNGLVQSERKTIHEKIGNVIEILFQDRLPEFYETLAYHFARGQSVTKAVKYLVKSGEKSLSRYAVDEAHQYFKKAYTILASREALPETEKLVLIDILNNWGYSYYYLGENKEFIALLESNEALAESLQDKARVGLFYAWYGLALLIAGRPKDSYDNLRKSLKFGEDAKNEKVIGYACTWLPFTCAELGLFAEGIGYGNRAQKIAELFPSDQYIFFKSLVGLCMIHFFKGDTHKVFEGSKRLLEYGQRNANNRSQVFGHFINAHAFWAIGDLKSAQKCLERATEVAIDPLFSAFPKASLGFIYFLQGQIQDAEQIFQSCMNFLKNRGLGLFYVTSQYYLAPILVTKGLMRQGMELMEKAQDNLVKNERRVQYSLSEHILGEVNLQIATGPKPSLSIMVKNIGFLIKKVPFATKNAEEHFNNAIDILKEIGAKGLSGPIYLSLGMLFKATKRTDQARQCILDAIAIFHECEAEHYLKQANEALESL